MDHVGNAGIYDIHVALLSHRHRHMHHFPISSTHHKGGPQHILILKILIFGACADLRRSICKRVSRLLWRVLLYIAKDIVCSFFGLFFFLCKSCALYRHFLVFIATKMSRSDFRSLVSRLCEKKCIRLSFFFSHIGRKYV